MPDNASFPKVLVAGMRDELVHHCNGVTFYFVLFCFFGYWGSNPEPHIDKFVLSAAELTGSHQRDLGGRVVSEVGGLTQPRPLGTEMRTTLGGILYHGSRGRRGFFTEVGGLGVQRGHVSCALCWPHSESA